MRKLPHRVGVRQCRDYPVRGVRERPQDAEQHSQVRPKIVLVSAGSSVALVEWMQGLYVCFSVFGVSAAAVLVPPLRGRGVQDVSFGLCFVSLGSVSITHAQFLSSELPHLFLSRSAGLCASGASPLPALRRHPTLHYPTLSRPLRRRRRLQTSPCLPLSARATSLRREQHSAISGAGPVERVHASGACGGPWQRESKTDLGVQHLAGMDEANAELGGPRQRTVRHPPLSPLFLAPLPTAQGRRQILDTIFF